MSDSRLVAYEHISSYCNKTNVKKMGITPHHAAGIWHSAKQGVEFFYGLIGTKRYASCTYVIANNGEIGQVCYEKDAAWTSSNGTNDASHVTIEVSNSQVGDKSGWPISDAAYKALVTLSADICKRNGIPSLHFDVNNKKGSVTVHKQFAGTACPGPYLYDVIRSGKYEADVNAMINGEIDYPDIKPVIIDPVKPVPVPVPVKEGYYYGGLDCSPVFDPAFYRSRYDDLAKAGLTTDKQLFDHFCKFGMNEARWAHKDFDPVRYRKANPDLDNLYGNAWIQYYRHYLICGKAEIEAGKRAKFMEGI